MKRYCTAGHATEDKITRRKSIACWIHKARGTHSENVILIFFHCNNGYTKAAAYYAIPTLSVLFVLFSKWYLLTYLLTPWGRVLLEKLTGLRLVKKFPAFHGTRRFITALTSVHNLSLSWASPIQSIYPHPTSWRSILILSTHLRLLLSSF